MAVQGIPWTKRYEPQSLSDVQGNNADIKRIQNWAENWTPGDQPLLLIGPPGVGKTTTATALARDMDWSMTEINASSERTKEDIQKIADEMETAPINGGQTLLFLDEVDSLGNASSLSPLIDNLSSPPCPVILAANEEWKVPGAIKRYSKQFDFSLGKRSIKARLKKICEAEDITISAQDLGKLATRGNLRAAINDLQTYAETGEMGWDERETEVDNFDVVDNVLRGKRYTGDMTPPTLVNWLEENLANDFRGLEVAMAYDALARADKWLGRVWEGQDPNYHWWRYAGRLADQTAELRLTEPWDGWIDKSYPQHFRESEPKPDDSSSESALYRTLKGYESGEFSFGGDYTYFRHAVLPQVLDFPTPVRLRLAAESGIQPGDDALSALNLTKRQYEEWLHEEIEDGQSILEEW